MPNNVDDLKELAIKVAALEASMGTRMAGIENGITDIKVGLSGIMDLREELARFGVHHEQFRSEAKAIWERVDSHKAKLEELQSLADNWRGRVTMLATVMALVGALGGSIVAWTWVQVQQVPILVERLQRTAKSLDELETYHREQNKGR